MQIEKNYLILCENVVRDLSGKLTLINIYDIVYAPTVPALHGNIYLVANFHLTGVTKEDKDLIIKLSFKSPSGKELIPSDQELQIKVDPSRKTQTVGLINLIQRVVFEEFGIYALQLSRNKGVLGSNAIEVLKQQDIKAGQS